METRITFKAQIGKRLYILYIDCNVNCTDDVTIKNGKYVIIYGHNVSIGKESDADYKDVFEISPDGDYHMMVEFKNDPKEIRIFSQESNGEMQFFIEGV